MPPQFDEDAYGDPPRKVTGCNPLFLLIFICAFAFMFIQVRGMIDRNRERNTENTQTENPQRDSDSDLGDVISVNPRRDAPTQENRADRGDWSIEEVDSNPSVQLSPGPLNPSPASTTPIANGRDNPRSPKNDRTKRGDWVIEEVDSTNPVRDSSDPTSTKKGDWSIEEVKP